MNPLDMVDYQPGAGPSYIPGKAPHTPEELANDMAELDGIVNELAQRLHTSAVSEITPVLDAHAELSGKMLGEPLNNLQPIEQHVDKLKQKLDTAAANDMFQIYAGMDSMGIPVPTADEIAYAKTTGDYLSRLNNAGQGTSGSAISGIQSVPQSTSPSGVPAGSNIGGQITLPAGGGNDTLPSGGGGQGGGGGNIPGPTKCQVIVTDRATGKTAPPECGCPPGSEWWQAWGFASFENCTAYLESIGADSTQCAFPCAAQPGGGGGPPTGTNCEVCPPGMYQWKVDATGNCFYSINGQPGSIPGATLVKKCPDVPPPPPPVQPGDGGKCCPPPTINVSCPPPILSLGGGGGGPQLQGGGEVCQPFALECSLPNTWSPGKFGIVTDDFCDEMERLSQGGIPKHNQFADLFKWSVDANTLDGIIGDIAKALTGSKQPVLPALSQKLGSWMDDIAKKLSTVGPCTTEATIEVAGWETILHFLNHWFGIVPDKLLEFLDQIKNYNCPIEVPGPGEADEALLADTISKGQWDCWNKTAGRRIKEAESVVFGKRHRVTPHELCVLLRRKLIDLDTFNNEMRRNGVLKDEDAKRIYDSTQHWPGVADITQFMRHNIGDPQVVQDNQLDKDFDTKFSQRMQDYAEGFGLTKQQMLDYWRVHWQYPSYTQLSEMLQRLRPGRVPNDVVTQQADVEKLLETIDFAPAWVKAMIAISYRLPTREDATKSFDLRQIDDAEYQERLQDVGYDENNAEFIYNQRAKLRDLKDARKAGYPSLAQLTKLYGDCLITGDELKMIAPLVSENDNQEEMAIDAANFARTVNVRRQAIAGISYQYRRGLITETQALDYLSSQGVDTGCIAHLLDRLNKQKQRTPKQLSAASLCKMRELGILSPEDQLNALVRTNWSTADAIRITQVCTANLAEKLAKQQAARLKAEQREVEKKLKAQRRQLKEDFCGPPPCPKTSVQHPGEVAPGLQNLDQEINAMDANGQLNQSSPDNPA